VGPLHWALKRFGTLPSSFNQLISLSAQYCRLKAILIEKCDNAPKNACSACKYQQVCKNALKPEYISSKVNKDGSEIEPKLTLDILLLSSLMSASHFAKMSKTIEALSAFSKCAPSP